MYENGRSKAAQDYGVKMAFAPLAAGLMTAGRMALPHLARGASKLFGGKLMAGLGAGSAAMAYNQARNEGHGILGSAARGVAGGLSFGAGKLGLGAQAANMALGAVPPPGGVPPPAAPSPGSMV